MSRRRRTGAATLHGTARATDGGIARAGTASRIAGVDAFRGIALGLMIAYHFAFDLRFYRVTNADFEADPFWLGLRALIVTLFMALVGVGLVLAAQAGASRAHFWRRIGLIAGCALAASVGSRVTFPNTWIYFGILHCIAVASVLASPFVGRPRVAMLTGVAAILAGLTLAHAAFDHRALSWIGFTTHKPATEDYVPLFPWSGVVLVGIAAGHALASRAFRPLAPLAAAPRWLRTLGRHSLLVYMVHQPILLGALWLVLAR
jgi:uncharacterized membrane protein